MASLVALLDAGTTPWRREWDAASGGHHVNLLSGRRYRGANPALLTLGMHLRGAALPYWCGFAEAKALGIFPRKGSKAVHVLRPQVHQLGEGQLAESGSAGKGGHGSAGANGQPSVQPGRSWVSYRPVALFNAVDLEGEALEALIQKRRQAEGAVLRPDPERLADAEAVLSRWPVPVSFAGDRACYLPLPDRIQLPDRTAFHSAGALYASWAHEVIHSTAHSSRLARDLSGGMGEGGDGGRPRRSHPLVVELADFVAERALSGLEPDLAARASVIRTKAVAKRTQVLVLRLRHQLHQSRWTGSQYEALPDLLVEECLTARVNGDGLEPLEGAAALELLEAPASSNIDPGQRQQWLQEAVAEIDALQPALAALAERRADLAEEDHRRVREASLRSGESLRMRFRCEPSLPVDVIGLIVLLPAPVL